MDLQYRCRHFQGAVPCKPHKEQGVECSSSCLAKDLTDFNLLVIKLGAQGDVIRTTPILTRLRRDYPQGRIFWLTQYPKVLPEIVDHKLSFNLASLLWLRALDFEVGINLDKDPEACALIEDLSVKQRYGFGLQDGMPAPLNSLSEYKFLTGISDRISQENRRHYLDEIFQICGWEYNGEEYLLPSPKPNPVIDRFKPGGTVVGLNTGCGGRWTSRLWPEVYWEKLVGQLKGRGYQVLLLGGPEEDDKNRRLSQKTGAHYLGVFSIREFMGLVKQCTVMVTTVTMALHFAIGLKIPVVLLNNIFNPSEFHFFTAAEILAPDKPCECYYHPTCRYERSCMWDLPPERVRDAVVTLLN